MVTDSNNMYGIRHFAQTVVLRFECAPGSPGGLVTAQSSGPPLKNSDSVGLGATLELAFLINSQGTLVLLALRPHLENH